MFELPWNCSAFLPPSAMARPFQSETPYITKTSSTPCYTRPILTSVQLKSEFATELLPHIFDEHTIVVNGKYSGNIIADTWIPNNELPFAPNYNLLYALQHSGGCLYDVDQQQWDLDLLSTFLHKEPPPRSVEKDEESHFCTFLNVVMVSLACHVGVEVGSIRTPPSLPESPKERDLFHTPPPHPVPQKCDPSPAPSSSLSREDIEEDGSLPLSFETPDFEWTVEVANRVLHGSHVQSKPDAGLVHHNVVGGLRQWNNVLMTAEVSSLDFGAQAPQIQNKAFTLFEAQPTWSFIYTISVCKGHYRLVLFDHAGGMYSRRYCFHSEPLPLLRILCAATFWLASKLGVDITFNTALHPVITVNEQDYVVIAKCFSSDAI